MSEPVRRGRHAAYFELDLTVFARLLRLPPGFRVLGIQQRDVFAPHAGVKVAIEGPGLPEVEEGDLTPKVMPMLREDKDGSRWIEIGLGDGSSLKLRASGPAADHAAEA